MANFLDSKSVEQLKMFITVCKANPALLHESKLSFFKQYLESLDAKIPPAPKTTKAEPTPEPPKPEPKMPEPTPEPTPEPMEDSSDEESVELDNTGVLSDEDELMALPMGDENKTISEDDMDKANDLRSQAMCAMSENNLEQGLRFLGEAIECNPNAAVLFAKRAQLLLRQKKAANAVRDADKALTLNPNNALAHKCRGKGMRLLGKWEEALQSLAAGQKCDYDDDTQELLNTIVKPNAEKLRQARLKKDVKRRERAHKEKVERIRKVKEERQKAHEEAKAQEKAGMPGDMPGGMPGMFDDPELAELLQDPEVVQAMAAIQQNPASMMQYMNNPKVMKVITKLQGKFGGGGMGGMPGGMGGMPGGMGGMPGGMGGMAGGMGGMPGGMPGAGGFPGGMPGGFPGGVPGGPTAGNTPPPKFNTSCDDVD